jgi:hypothetical protein
MVTKLSRGAKIVFVELTPGRSGVQSKIRKKDGTDFDRDVEDTEFTPLRHLMYAPPGGHHIILLAERVGTAGALTMSSRLVKGTFDKYYPDLRLSISPAMREDLLRKATDDHPVKALVFKRPRPIDPGGKLIEVASESVEVEVRLTPRRRRYWLSKALPKGPGDERPTRESMLGILAPIVHPEMSEQAAVQSLLDEGWHSSLSVKMPGGTQRLVDVHASKAVTMSFPILSEADETIDAGRPDDEQFRTACADTLLLLEGQFNVTASSAGDCKWSESPWEDEPGAEWEVVWDDPGTATTRS